MVTKVKTIIAASAPVTQGDSSKPTTLYTVSQYANVQPAFPQASLRSLIFNAKERQSSNGAIPGNGLIECGAILRVGKKVLIDDQKFVEWVRKQSQEVK